MKPPAYFEPIRRKAADRWDRWEANPEDASLARILFMQVQSPRQVVSELLQNADDAGATQARVSLEDGVFTLEHDGADFTEDQFASLCTFGYSNKRALHTIGFRGIGFKSTFSLGEPVCLITPTLAVAFNRSRFFEPVWTEPVADTKGWTRVSVRSSDVNRREDLERSLTHWSANPISLLFFRSIRRLQIGDQALAWSEVRPGPIEGSQWLSPEVDGRGELLLIRSREEPFPEESIEELREEHLLGSDEGGDFPPCTVDLALVGGGGVFSVLPTGLETRLPFACNAPFVPDPARLKIKDPATSATNRWLLARIGRLAAEALIAWAGDASLPEAVRAQAYDLVPDVPFNDSSPAGVCGQLVEEEFDSAIAGQDVVLTEAGALVAAGRAVVLPRSIRETWPTEPVAKHFTDAGLPAVSAAVAPGNMSKLVNKRLAVGVTKAQVTERLRGVSLPKPESWDRLLRLWEYLAADASVWPGRHYAPHLRIVPIRGRATLGPAEGTFRLGSGRQLASGDDWAFLTGRLQVIDGGWVGYLDDGAKAEQEHPAAERARFVAAAQMLSILGLAAATPSNGLVNRLDARLDGEDASLEDRVRLAHIAARLAVEVSAGYTYVTRSGAKRGADAGVIRDPDGTLVDLVSAGWADDRVLNGAYEREFTSCSREDWGAWAASARSRLEVLPRLVRAQDNWWWRGPFEAALRERGYTGSPGYPYTRFDHYWIYDYDLEPVLRQRAAEDPERFWREFTRLLLRAPEATWKGKTKIEALQGSSTGHTYAPVHVGFLPAAWLRTITQLAILPDTRGTYRRPDELLRWTAATEMLVDVEPFIDKGLDTEASRELLDILGVRSTPTGPGTLLDRIRVLSGVEDPPAGEIDKWYRRLDRLTDTASTEVMAAIRRAFAEERLILDAEGAWARSGAVSIGLGDTDLPGIPRIRPSVTDLALWPRIGVPERPMFESALAWLQTLPSDGPLAAAEAKRVRVILAHDPRRAWEEGGRWLNLTGALVPTENLRYAHRGPSRTSWSHLFPSVRDVTAVLTEVPPDAAAAAPFGRLSSLTERIEERVDATSHFVGEPERRPWLNEAGSLLGRAQFDDDDVTQRVRETAVRLAETDWRSTDALTVTPYLDGSPVGTPRDIDVAWLGTSLMVRPLGPARLARRVPEVVGGAFGRLEVQNALAYAYDRPVDQVRAYFEANFTLDEPDAGGTDPAETADSASTLGPLTPVLSGELGLGSTAAELGGPQGADGWILDQHDDRARHERVSREASARPRRRPLIARFAALLGFDVHDADQFRHADGRTLAPSESGGRWWDLWDADDELLCSYRPIDHCLDTSPLELDAETWRILEQDPTRYALVLVDRADHPVATTGAQLVAMREEGSLVLYPAAYRLVRGPVD